MAFDRKYIPKDLTTEEQKRLIELEFCFGIDKMFTILDDREETYDILDNLCSIANVDPSLIRTAAANIRSLNSTLRPTREELSIFLYRVGNKAKGIGILLGLSQNTVYGHIRKYYTHSERQYLPLLKSTYQDPLRRFTAILRELLNYDEFTIHR